MKTFKYILICFCIIATLFLSTIGFAATLYSYSGKTSITFNWQHSKDVIFDHYEIRLNRLNTSGQTIETFTYGTINLNISILRPRAGIYSAQVRAVNKTSTGEFLFSDWCYSLSVTCAKLKNGTNGDWLVQWKLGAPLGPIILSFERVGDYICTSNRNQ
jgi:hypothetical protein